LTEKTGKGQGNRANKAINRGAMIHNRVIMCTVGGNNIKNMAI
jgi:hypothetical protein